jgi:hypothetical protein
MSHQGRKTELAKLARDFRVSSSVTDEAVVNFLSSLDCPRALTVWLLYSNEEFDQLVSLGIDTKCYPSGDAFRDAYIATHFLSKASFLETTVSKRDVAIEKFLKYEQQCRRTNTRFKNLASEPSYNGPNASILSRMERKIHQVLGSYSADEFVDGANWGPGVTTLLKGEHVSDVNKFQSDSGITRDLYSFVSPWFSLAYPLWADHLESEFGPSMFELQHGNEVVTVPKNSKTDRVIAIEPAVNLWFQKSIGSMIRRRLKREGIDLNSQERNQKLAYEGSTTYPHGLATVDFSSASDSISSELIREVVPPRWFSLLDVARSKIGNLDGSIFKWEKFSSMGNGFTFELESLIFYAAAMSVCEHLQLPTHQISVFGDDVIIPVDAYQLFSSFCEFLGFTVNDQKSFSDGYFRESCGSHYYDGLCCKPLYLKERLHNVQTIYKLANSIRRLAHRECNYHGCAGRWWFCYTRLSRRVPNRLRLVIPEGIGDSGFVGNFDEAAPSLACRGPNSLTYQWEGYFVHALVESGEKSSEVEGVGLLLARLWGRSIDQAHGNTYVLRGRTRVRFTRVLVPQWYDLGGWVSFNRCRATDVPALDQPVKSREM